jgi:hypothetical protein
MNDRPDHRGGSGSAASEPRSEAEPIDRREERGGRKYTAGVPIETRAASQPWSEASTVGITKKKTPPHKQQ